MVFLELGTRGECREDLEKDAEDSLRNHKAANCQDRHKGEGRAVATLQVINELMNTIH